jgi:hypothetical protein
MLVEEDHSMKNLSLAGLLILLSQAAAAQYQGSYFVWHAQQGSARKCASTAPNHQWKQDSGPYLDGECTSLLPDTSSRPGVVTGASSGSGDRS